MRRFVLLLALLLGITAVYSAAPPAAEAYHHHWGGGGWGWGGHRYYGGWGGGYGVHRNWGFGRGYVYRPIYRPYYGYGYRGIGYRGYGYRGFGYPGFGGYYGGYGGYGYNSFYPTINYGYYPSYGYSNYYNGCAPVYQTYSSPIYYDTQYAPNPLFNYYSGVQNGGLSTQLTAGTAIAQLADSIRNQRLANGANGGRVLDGGIVGNTGVANGRLRGVVQNIVGGVIQNQQVNANTVTVRYANPDARSKARAYMTQGDTMFREQRYAAAAQQYRAAASMAPDLAEANWRYAHTLVAMGENDLAVNAINRALAASPDISRNGFSLDQLYGTMGMAKQSHLERLASAALESDSPNAYFLLGFTMRYSGEAQRAEKFFAKAAEVNTGVATHITAFAPAVRTAPARATSPAPEPPPMLARLPANEI
ncbi:tetratricopeptide repeat protein [Anatilimnocola floriformis]|uniref:tetratricopeptide repeat protein n=1 Tax=Anatilimnocola floriformis TaxID=2948575 RepID=UPI0020C330FF|nr:tetratricopeptide repeat protein [Anatilimnocola floriformis]